MMSSDERKPRIDPLIGTLVNGKFRIERAIARGGMGRIYYGIQAPLDRPVAVKVVKADGVNEEDSQFLKRFLLEASILAKLQHPNIVTLFDYGRIENHPTNQETYFIAMEFLNGETLSDRLRDVGSLTSYETLPLFRQMLRGLREAHARGIIHRDLKPSNIIIVPEADGEIVKLVDFGIGKVSSEGNDLTRDGILVGTPKYMAPEQFDGSASPASDVYALGTIIYQLLVGDVPFNGSNMAEFMMAKLTQPVPAMKALNPICDSSELLEHLVYGMLQRRPNDRPTLEQVFDHLARCEEEVFGSGAARISGASGSRPIATGNTPPSMRQQSIGALRVPYTIVQPMPMPGAPPSSPSGVAALNAYNAITNATQGAMSRSQIPAAPQPQRTFPLAALLAICFGLASVGGTAIYFARARKIAAANTAMSSVPSAMPLPSASAATPENDSFVLHLDSAPTGATVMEDGVALGSTPLDIRLDRGALKSGPRSFQLKKDGFVTATYNQGTADARVDEVVTLATDTGKPGKTPHVAATGKLPSGGGKPTPPSGGGDSDIRLKR